MTNKEILHSILIDYFGDANVDFKENNEILIYFPKVTVTNENDKSIEITKLFVKVVVDEDCSLVGTFTMNRSEFTADQFRSDYLHSHIYGIPARNGDASYFSTPCLGTGPIRQTCTTLNNEFSEEFWNLFCRELSLYVTRESLTGVPYRHLEQVGIKNGKWIKMDLEPSFHSTPFLEDSVITQFIRDILKDMPFRFNYVNGSYGVAMSPFEWHIAISNKFIEWYNSRNKEFRERVNYRDYMTEVKIEGSTIYYQINSSSRNDLYLSEFIGKRVCTFKGEEVSLSITGINQHFEDENITLVLNLGICQHILAYILKIVNFGYGNSNKPYNSSDRSTLVTPINQTIYYL